MGYEYYITPDDIGKAAQNGVDEQNLKQRVYRYGWQKSDAISTPIRPRGKYTELAGIAEQNGLQKQTFYYRIRSGWDPEQAAVTPALKGTARAEVANKKTRKYPRWAKNTAKNNEICSSTFYYRMRRGWGAERACTEPVQGKGGDSNALQKTRNNNS